MVDIVYLRKCFSLQFRTMIRYLFGIIFVFLSLGSFAQKCETYDRSLFHRLPKDFPNEINCVDTLEQKQGKWIEYVIDYNPVDMLDDLPKGNYVGQYRYGNYLDGKKIGDWKTIANRQAIYEIGNENYYYGEDTTIITRSAGFRENEYRVSLYFNSDKSLFIKTNKSDLPIIIERDTKRFGPEIFRSRQGDKLTYLPIRFLPVVIDWDEVAFEYGKLELFGVERK